MIVAAAYRLTNGLVLSMPAPAFHQEVRAGLRLIYGHFKHDAAEIGYMTDGGVFLPLYEALKHAEQTGQVTTGDDGVKTIQWGDLKSV